ncbi:14030_t:CDS:2 [Entrophospora sp. SA101]|nr:14030_t:CDS:2 [Entrophospora sp. SA101]
MSAASTSANSSMKKISKQSDNRWTKELYQTRKEWNVEKLKIQGQVDLG